MALHPEKIATCYLINCVILKNILILSIMNPQLEEIREQQKQSWNNFSQGWKKWDDLTMDFLRPMGEAIIKAIKPFGKDIVLDIASGTGEPGLTIATMLSGGKVVLTDLSDDMLAIARENADKRGISNIDTTACDVCSLPFENESFNAISCRFGFMFFPDMQLAASEMARVLKPGSRIATSVWNIPEKNFWVTAMMGTINKNMELPKPPLGAPGMFRCCPPGLMRSIFELAGFKNIREEEVKTTLNSGTIDTYWNMMTEVGAPIVAALNKADECMRNKIKEEVFALIGQKYTEGKVAIEGSAIIISAEK
jgi:ubiquinone/menaquinone biosynthesis C-methylase UbiE